MAINNLIFFHTYDGTLEQNAEYLRQILPIMSKNKISTDPLNIAIFYEYIIGGNVNLNNELNELLNNNTVFTSELSSELFKKHIYNISINSLEQINHNLLQLINKTVKAIDNTGEKANTATIHFQNQCEKLKNTQGLPEINKIVTEIIEGTEYLAETSLALQTQLDERKKDILLLQQELAEANEITRIDALTGLLNRRAFDQTLDKYIKMHKQANFDLCLLILDVDHFKQVNDRFGHQVGDNVLRYIANKMTQFISTYHFAARYGGEEMAIIMPNTMFFKAMTIAENIRLSLDKHSLTLKDSQQLIGKVTVSIGVASLIIHDSPHSLIKRADDAMYRAKNNGRNQVMAENNS